LHDAADENDILELGLKRLEVGSSFVSVAENLPASAIVVNRILGLGLSSLATREDIETIVSIYSENNVAQYFVQLHPDAGPGELPDWMISEGLKSDRGWQKFPRNPVEVKVPKTDLT
jgi:hypothetical protein